MANPNSLLTVVRYRLAQWLDPYPDRGEGWCINCSLNDGRTLIVPATGHARHVREHQEDPENTSVAMRVNWGQITGPDEED